MEGKLAIQKTVTDTQSKDRGCLLSQLNILRTKSMSNINTVVEIAFLFMAFNIQGTYDNNLNLVCTKLFSPESNRGCYSECLERLCHFWKFLERHVADSMTSHDVIGKMKNQVVQSWSYNISFERKFNADEYSH